MNHLGCGCYPGRWFAVLWLMMLLCSIPTASYAKDSGVDGECTATNARPMPIVEAARGGRRHEGACVRISGIVDFWTVYGSLGDLYRSTRTWHNHDPRGLKRARVGLGVFPADDDGTEKGWPWTGATPHRITLVGRLHECGRDPDTGKPYEGYVMELNWCHHNGGSILLPDMILADDPVELTRMTGKRAWRQFGDLVPARKGSPLEANALEYVFEMFLAAHKGDRRAILDLYDFSSVELSADGTKVIGDMEEEPELSEAEEESKLSEAQHVLDLWFGNSDLEISQVARSARPPAVRIFESRWKGDDGQGPWACWARVPLPEDLWPISSVDTGNISGRPYACVELDTELYEPDKILTAVFKKNWDLKEPVH